jgi:hypothetical protein
MVTENACQSIFLGYEKGLVVIDAPPSYSKHLRAAVAEVTNLPVTLVRHSQSPIDPVGGVLDLGGQPILITHEETTRLPSRSKIPTAPFRL